MNVQDLIDDFASRQIRLASEGDRLLVHDSSGSLTPEDRAIIRNHKAQILAAIQRPHRSHRPHSGSDAGGCEHVSKQRADGRTPAEVLDLSIPPRPCPRCAAPIAWRHADGAITCFCSAEPPPGLEKVVLMDTTAGRRWLNFDDEFGTDEDRTFFDFDGQLWIWCAGIPEEFQFPDERPSEYRGLIGCGFPPVPTKEAPLEIVLDREIVWATA